MIKAPLLSGKTKVAGVMGWPVGHSKSPRLHGFWLRQYYIDGIYIPMAVRPEETEKALRALPVLGFCGANLTLPHKETAMKIVDHIDPVAKRVGAANTIIVREDGSLEGRNTDVHGFAENLRTAGFSFNNGGKTATVLGAGGAARATIVALQDMGAQEIHIINRSIDRAGELAESLGQDNCRLLAKGWDEVSGALACSDLLVNTTSLGMTGQDPLTIDLSPLKKSAWVTDAVYAPLETALLKQAKDRGLSTVDGLGMLLHQAAPGFAAWFGVEPQVTADLRAAVLGAE